jgi:uncharacterized protein YkwD
VLFAGPQRIGSENDGGSGGSRQWGDLSVRVVASLTLVFASLLAVVLTAPAYADAGKPRLDRVERSVIRAINRERAGHGLAALRASSKLARAADFHSWEMLDANYFAHTSRNGGPFDRRVRRYARHRAVGETLAWVSRCGRRSGRQVVRMWMNSSGHRAILLSSTFRRVGIGKRTGSLGSTRACMVTADFGSRR